jgi:hypothetical protein
MSQIIRVCMIGWLTLVAACGSAANANHAPSTSPVVSSVPVHR